MLWIGWSVTAADAALRVPNLFRDHMVLQRDMPAAVWGWAEPGERVRLSLDGNIVRCRADGGGRWRVKLPSMSAGGPHTLHIRAGDEQLTIGDVMFGEVWLCSGQSNMGWPVWATEDAQAEIIAANYPEIRLFTTDYEPQPMRRDDTDGQWEVCSAEAVREFSAVGYFFGRQLYGALRIPIGLIHSSWPGSVAESWTRLEVLEDNPAMRPILERWAKVPVRPDIRKNLNRPGVLYDNKIAPLVGYTIRGVIWYQGESNTGHGHEYESLFPVMIRNWRRDWGQGDFPFYFVQISNIQKPPTEPGPSTWAIVREAQLKTMQTLANTGMAVAFDVGQANDVHPRNKQDVGKRLARWALARDYGFDIHPSGPIYRAFSKRGDRITIHFDHVGEGLWTYDHQPVKGFAIAGWDRQFYWAEARIKGDTVVVWSGDVPDPVAVRYGWANNLPANLYNKDDLPACPFRTDTWPNDAAAQD